MAITDVLVTTTSTIQGYEVLKYIKPLSAHIVAGTNFFSDFAASFTDIFGGRSGTYQRQVTVLYNEAIKQLKQAAQDAGANCILGLSIDLDEISGQGKSMFMITAIGTAVIVQHNSHDTANADNNSIGVDNVISLEKLNLLSAKKKLLNDAENNSLQLNDEKWSFLIDNQIHELFPYIMNKWRANYDPEAHNTYLSKMSRLVATLPDGLKSQLVYNALLNETNEKIISGLSTIIRDLQIWDFEKIKENLLSDELIKRKRILIAAIYDKASYSHQDMKEIDELLSMMRTAFVERGQKSFKKQLLSSKEKEVWNCECGKQNISSEYCPDCQKNIYGFSEKEFKPESAISILNSKKELLTEYFLN